MSTIIQEKALQQRGFLKNFDFNQYKSFISFGYFCEVTEAIQREGLRFFSGPFDWTLSDFEGIIAATTNHFEDYLNSEYLLQSRNNPSHYLNTKYNVEFFHDFSQYKSLSSQLAKVSDKYSKRISRYYSEIAKPTVFLRYVRSQEELDFISQNYSTIVSLFASFNSKNILLFIANEDLNFSQIGEIQQFFFKVKKDPNDVVCRDPIKSCIELKDFFDNFPNDFRSKESIKKYNQIQRKQKCFFFSCPRRCFAFLKKIFLRVYDYPRKY